MKVLLIGGTGTISSSLSRIITEKGWELWVINRGNKNEILPPGTKEIRCDINNESEIAAKLEGHSFDAVADFIVYSVEQAERDYRLFRDRTKQYIFISSASVYQKPPSDFRITEGTPHANPFWDYSQKKIACEDFFISKYRENAFPVTIVLPSHTYDERRAPMGIHGAKGSWQNIKRMLEKKPVIIHGDGTSLWTMTHSMDFAEAFAGLIGNVHAIGESIHITSDETLTWNQVYKIIADALGVPLNAVHISSEFLAIAGAKAGSYNFTGSLIGDKANSVVFDNSKLKRLVPGFTAKIRLDQGIRKVLDYILSHKECQTDDPEFDAWCDKVIKAQEKALEFLKT